MGSSRSQSADVGGGDRLKGGCFCEHEASFVRKTLNVYPRPLLHFVPLQHLHCYWHSSIFSALSPSSLYESCAPSHAGGTTRAFKAQTALTSAKEETSGTRALTASKTVTAAEMRLWFMVNTQHLRLKNRKKHYEITAADAKRQRLKIVMCDRWSSIYIT